MKPNRRQYQGSARIPVEHTAGSVHTTDARNVWMATVWLRGSALTSALLASPTQMECAPARLVHCSTTGASIHVRLAMSIGMEFVKNVLNHVKPARIQ